MSWNDVSARAVLRRIFDAAIDSAGPAKVITAHLLERPRGRCIVVTPDTLSRMLAAGIAPRAALSAHDSYTAFKAVGDLLMTGPTLTNVNDIRAILVG